MAVALGFGELTGSLLGGDGTLLSGVGDRFVDLGAAALRDVAIRLFGLRDKAALVVGIVAVCLGLGAVVGVVAARRRVYGVGGFVLAGGVAVAVAAGASPAPGWALALSAIVAAVVGSATLLALLAVAARQVPPEHVPSERVPPDHVLPGRVPPEHLPWEAAPSAAAAPDRRFVTLALTSVAVGGVAGFSGRALRLPSTGPLARALAEPLPPPRTGTSLPSRQPFAVAGLSPYVTPTRDFYRIDTALIVPRIDPGEWRLRIDGRVDRPIVLTYREVLEAASVAEPITLACVSNEVGGDLVGNAVWQGVPLRTLLDRVGVQPGGTQVLAHSHDGFTAGFPTELALDGRPALVAVGMNGAALTVEHGFPARIVVAGLYGYVSAVKWLTRIELTGLDEADGYWISRGWSKFAPVKMQSRIDVPRAGQVLRAGAVDVAGVAWAPTAGVSRVEVQVDGGPWRRADLGAAASGNTWVQWRFRWPDAAPGQHVLTVRATGATGEPQVAVPHPPAPDGATGLHRRQVVVRGAA